MGYNTYFEGKIKMSGIDPFELFFLRTVHLYQYFGEEISEHKDWIVPEDSEFDFINLNMDQYNNLIWDKSEKSYDMEGQVRFIIQEAVAMFPEVKFNGEFFAQGDDNKDLWKLIVKDNEIKIFNYFSKDGYCICPNCHHKF